MDLNFILQHAAGNLYWKDKEGRYLGANQAFIKLAGLNQISDLVGKTDRDLFASVMSSEKLSLLEETDRRIMTSGIEESLKEEGIDANGCPAFYMTKKIPIRDEKGEVIGLMGTSLDITKELQADIARTEFLENMRHDIRTPLTGIVGFADIIKIEANSPQLREYADNLVASSHALLHLLDEVLEAIRVSSGEIPKLKKKFNLEKSLQNVIELNRAKAAQKKLTLSLDVDAAIPTYVLGDKVRFHRIALELIANALNFTDIGFVKLSVKLAKRHHRELILKLVVKDSGIGIPKEKQQEIYVQFKRLTPSYQGIYKGAGLGLSVIKQFIDDLDGEIYVESEPKKGTRFTCVIPLQEPLLDDDLGIDEDMEKAIDHPYEMTYTEQIKPTISKAAARSFQVLVVEDNVIAQTVAKSILAQLDCDTDIAETGKKAVELWKQGHYDLMFMDIGLPDIDGYEVTRLIRVQELAKNTHVPIIALTAHAGDENKKRCIDAGMNAVLTKPLTIKSCTDIVDAFIPGRHKEETSQNNEHYLSDLPEQEEELFNLSEFPTLDIEEGIKTTGNKSMLADMLTFMINDSLPKDLALMKAAYESHNWDKTQQLAHKIKGGAVYVGTIKIKMACQFLERYWKSGQRDLFEKLYQQAVTTIEESMQEIKRWLENQ